MQLGEDIPPEAVERAELLTAHLGSLYEPSLIVFDMRDYSTRLELLDEFRHIAFTWRQGQPTSRVPQEIQGAMGCDNCTSLVWLSRRALLSERILFVWILAHELRHVYQARTSISLNQTRGVALKLRRRQEFLSLPPSFMTPDELDAELCALKVVQALFEPATVSDLLDDASLLRYPFRAYSRFLSELASLLT